MKMLEQIKQRLLALVKDRNFTFIETKRADAETYLDKFRVFEGLSIAEIEVIEQELGQRFPDDFREYLKTFGKRGGLLFEAGADLHPNEIVAYQKYGQQLLNSGGITDFFKEDSIVFYMHQGYTFCCFQRESSSEPYAIFYYCEGDEAPRRVYDNFTKMLEVEMKMIEGRHEEIKQMGGFYIKCRDGYEEHTMPSGGIMPRDAEDSFLD